MYMSKAWFAFMGLLALGIGFNIASVIYAKHIADLEIRLDKYAVELHRLKAAEEFYIHEIDVLNNLIDIREEA